MPLIHGVEVGRLQRPGIGQGPEAFQPFNLGDGSIDVHSANAWMRHPDQRTRSGHPRFLKKYNRLQASQTTGVKPKFSKPGSHKDATAQILFDNEQLVFSNFREATYGFGLVTLGSSRTANQ
jgi:hypothetical protein